VGLDQNQAWPKSKEGRFEAREMVSQQGRRAFLVETPLIGFLLRCESLTEHLPLAEGTITTNSV
jgi:hypothetical protein